MEKSENHSTQHQITSSEVQLHLKSFGIAPDDSSQAYVSERVRGKLGKFAFHIQDLEIRMKRQGWIGNEPRVSCALSATLDGGGRVAVERCAPEARAAFDHTMGVAERLIRRTLQRLRHQ
jgi:ribosome-associated translation inhibitor RaiA